MDALGLVGFWYFLLTSLVFCILGVLWPKQLIGDKILRTLFWVFAFSGFGLALWRVV